jgi:hypothetical protein
MVLFYENRVLGVKAETTPGTKVSLVAADAAMNVYDADIMPELQWEDRMSQNGFGTLRSYHTGQVGKATFKIDLAYGGTSIPAYLTTLLSGCGIVLNTRKFQSKLEAPDAPSAAVKCLTIGLWMDGKFGCIYGAAGNVKMEAKSSQIVTFEFEFTGILDVEVDTAIVAPTYPDENAIKIRAAGGVTTFNSVAMCMDSVTVDFGGQVIGKKCISAEKGFDFFMVANRMPKVTASPESKYVAQQDRLLAMLNSEVYPLVLQFPATGYVAGTDAKSIKFIAPKAQLKGKKPGNREGIATDDLEFQCNIDPATPNNEFSMEFFS